MRGLLVACLLLAGCAHTPEKIAVPPEIIEVPKYMPLPAECSKKATVDLPVGSTPNDVMTKQKKALDELEAQITRCFGSAGEKVL